MLFHILRWRRYHAVTEVDIGLLTCNLYDHYSYTHPPPQSPANGGYARANNDKNINCNKVLLAEVIIYD